MKKIGLDSLEPAPGAVRNRKRVGRGPGSGHGKTAGRGHKGRLSRSGGSTRPGYEGGQMPLQLRLPKRGFRNPGGRDYAVVNLRDLERKYGAGETVDPDSLRDRGLVRKKLPVKILGEGTLSKPLTVRAHRFSARARERIEGAGGRVEEIAGA
ncbi:MAG: 50S ribosomal protein L15 [Candidatus Binatia bacterium]|nr:MAG: 50S ribosomal protein L15 [Candidatus Binatia bacterium]